VSSLSDEIARAFDAIAIITAESDPNATPAPQFDWKGQTYDAISAIETDGNLFGGGGLTIDDNLMIVARQSVFASDLPKPEDYITYRGTKFIIDTAKTDSSSAGIILSCRRPERGAGILERQQM
jgi:hypothetical protein